MPDIKISELPAATAPSGAELLEVVQSGANRRATLDALVRGRIAAAGLPAYDSATGVITLTAATVRALFAAAGVLGYDAASGTMSLSSATVRGQVSAGGLLSYDAASGLFTLAPAAVRSQISAGGVLSYDSATGAMTLPVATVRGLFSAGPGIAIDAGTGVISADGTEVDDLPIAGTLADADLLPVLQAAGGRRLSLGDLRAWMRGILRVVRTETAGYAPEQADNAALIRMNAGSGLTLTLNALAVGTQIEVVQAGAGKVTVVAGSGQTVTNREGKLRTTGIGAMATLICDAANHWIVTGDLESAA